MKVLIATTFAFLLCSSGRLLATQPGERFYPMDPLRQGVAGSDVPPPSPMARPSENVPPVPPAENSSPAAAAPASNGATCNCGGSGTCDQCGGNSCADCDRCLEAGWVGGVEIAFLKPYSFLNVALTHEDAARVANSNAGTSSQVAFDFGFDATPRIWLGYVDECGFGWRVRYWSLDETSTVSRANTSNDFYSTLFFNDFTNGGRTVGDTFHVQDRIRAYTVDGEIMRRMELGCWDINAGGGIRGGSLYTDYNASFTLDGDPGSEFDASHFNGAGPTVFAEMQHPLGLLGLCFVTNVRGSILFGVENVTEHSIAYTESLNTFRNLETVGIGEVQVGLQWGRELCGGWLSVYGLWEGQIWEGTGVAPVPIGNLGLTGFVAGVSLTR